MSSTSFYGGHAKVQIVVIFTNFSRRVMRKLQEKGYEHHFEADFRDKNNCKSLLNVFYDKILKNHGFTFFFEY